MARIQVLPLPAEQVGALSSAPYLLVIDGLSSDESCGLVDSIASGFKERTGAKGILVFEFPVDVA